MGFLILFGLLPILQHTDENLWELESTLLFKTFNIDLVFGELFLGDRGSLGR